MARPKASRGYSGRPFALAAFALLFAIVTAAPAWSQVSVTTEGYNNSRTASNPNEVILNTSNVNVNQFGKLFSYTVDGAVFAQPLYVPNVAIPGNGTHNVLYIATMNDVVYAFDADSNTGANASPLWSVDFRNPAAGVVPIPSPGNIVTGNIGITSTPVIDLTTNTMYVVTYAFENGSPVYRLRAIDITTGAAKFGGSVVVAASVPGNGLGTSGGTMIFNPSLEMQRTALGLANGMVFFGFSAFGDLYVYHGWVMAYNAQTLQQTGATCITPNGTNGGIWMSGRGPVIDSNGNVYYMTGDGLYDGITDFGDSFVKYSTTNGAGFSFSDWFAPDDYAYLDSNNEDLGSDGPMLIPRTNLIIGGGKSHTFYLLNALDLGHEQTGNGQIIESFMNSGGVLGPVYYDRTIGPGPWMYVWGFNNFLNAYHFNGTTFDTTPVSTGTIQGQSGSFAAALAVTANGSTPGTGIVWASMPSVSNGLGGTVSGVIRAFDASNLTKELWDSLQNPGRDDIGTWAKFRSPLVVNGKLYMGTTSNIVSVYGLLSSTADFTVSATPGTQSFVPGGSATYTVNVGALNGFAGTVSLSASGLPTGASASFNPSAITGSGSTTLTVTTSSNTPSASSTLTITGTSGSLCHIAAVVLAPPISVTPSPATSTMGPNETQQFTALVQNSTSQSVTWSISPNVGTILPTGLYTSPSVIPTAQTITVTATSVDDPTKFGTAQINLIAGVGGGVATFIGTDTATQGNWQGVYGGDGYSLSQSSQSLPSYGTMGLQAQSNYIWNPSTSDPRALELPGGASRIAATWYNSTTFTISLNFTDGNSHKVAFYALDWDSKSRAETFQIVDATTGIILDTESVSSFTNGTYLIWNILGSVNINVTATSGPNSVVSGVFFGGAASSESVVITPATISLTSGQSQQFTATVNGAPATQTVTWSISGVSPAGAATGSFSPSTAGLYVAPATVTTSAQVTVKATTADGTASKTATVSLAAPTVGPVASFVKMDTTTQGSWHGVYGANAYSVAQDSQTSLSYGTYAVQSPMNYTWNPSTADPRALQNGANTGRLAATWYSPSSFSFDVNFTDGNSHQVAVYALDWDSQGRTEMLQVVDPATNNVRNTQTLSSFIGGTYVIWNITGHVTISVKCMGGPNAVISGIFFDNVGGGGGSPVSVNVSPQSVTLTANQTQPFTATVVNSTNQSVTWSINPNVGSINSSTGLYTAPATIASNQAPVTVTATSAVGPAGNATVNLSSGAVANFVHLDTTTQGNWHGVYGADGYSVAQDSQSLPSYATFTSQNYLNWIWASNPADQRALQTGNNTGRIAATWYNYVPFSMDVNFTDTNTHQFSMYAVDWDSQGRTETIQILDATSNAVLNTQTISSFTGGVYLVWNISGHVTIAITSNTGPNAVISGVFFK
ncbi:MAG: hypothetical protein ABSE45_07720 [Candidatus Acidiferrales bacterium]